MHLHAHKHTQAHACARTHNHTHSENLMELSQNIKEKLRNNRDQSSCDWRATFATFCNILEGATERKKAECKRAERSLLSALAPGHIQLGLVLCPTHTRTLVDTCRHACMQTRTHAHAPHSFQWEVPNHYHLVPKSDTPAEDKVAKFPIHFNGRCPTIINCCPSLTTPTHDKIPIHYTKRCPTIIFWCPSLTT